MMQASRLTQLGIINIRNIYEDLPDAHLMEIAIQRGEGLLAENGALSVHTGKYTGRSPMDRFIVDSTSVHDAVSWGKNNQPMDEEIFWRIFYRLTAYLEEKDLFVFNGFSGADKTCRVPLTVITQYAWQNLFARQLFIRPESDELENHTAEYTLICVPGFNAFRDIDGTRSESFVILNLEKKIIIIGGTHYAGEMKKAMFTAMNFMLPEKNILPMHCSATLNEKGETTLFFGLSGTGKTTLSATPDARLIGDDEHGWSDHGVFNFEGGCYAKCIHLSRDKEPQIWDAIRFGSILENVALNLKTRKLDYDDDTLTENTRAAYPIENIPNSVIPGIGGHPTTLIFLTADAFGILPPVARLSAEQAVFHFLSGYTSKLAGTERGVTQPEATFSTGFGEPFLPRHPEVYAKLLEKKIRQHQVNIYLVNTGWTAGGYGVGYRIALPHTRILVKAAMEGAFDAHGYRKDPHFDFDVPLGCEGFPSELLDPRNTWADVDAYDIAAQKLVHLYNENFKKFDRGAHHYEADKDLIW